MFFFFNDTATTEIYTLSLHDALPIYTDQVFLGGQVVHRVEEEGPIAHDVEEGVGGEIRVAHHGDSGSACDDGGRTFGTALGHTATALLWPEGNRGGAVGRDRAPEGEHHQGVRPGHVVVLVELHAVAIGLSPAVLRRIDDRSHRRPRHALGRGRERAHAGEERQGQGTGHLMPVVGADRGGGDIPPEMPRAVYA